MSIIKKILNPILNPKYKKAYDYIENSGLRMEDATIATNGKKKIILGEKNIIFIYGKNIEEMSYDSFIDLNEKQSEVCSLLEKKKFVNTKNAFGVKVYEKGDRKFLLGKDLRLIWGNDRETFDYDQGIWFIKFDLYGSDQSLSSLFPAGPQPSRPSGTSFPTPSPGNTRAGKR